VFGDLALVLEVLGWFVPIVGAAFQGLAILPFAALGARHRARTVLVAVFAASAVSFLVGGVGIVVETALAGALGFAVGTAYRKGWKPGAAVAMSVVTAAIPVAVLSVVAEAISPGLRRLAFAQVKIAWRVARMVLKSVGLTSVVGPGNSLLGWIITHWWLSVPGFEFLAVVLAEALCARYLWPFLVRVDKDSPARGLPGLAATAQARSGRQPEPVPVELDEVSYQYPGSNAWALACACLRLEPGSFIAVVGPNGSGKSTLVRLLAGREFPTLGSLKRAGDPGLGMVKGTSMIFQRPESQVLGVRARDDVVWGLPPWLKPDVGALLARVGLEGFEERETSGLSGGELQRLAIAACLARQPKLLISDEATAMIDGPGREALVALLESLAADGMAVVHVTHREAETLKADLKVEMLAGRLVAVAPPDRRATEHRGRVARGEPPVAVVPPTGVPSATAPWARAPRRSLLRVRELTYAYAQGTPWEHSALSGIDLDLDRGQGLVVTGDNGSGKSTLVWVLAGLLEPSEGEVLLDGQPIVAGSGAVGVSFQHARLQLLRPSVISDVAYGADEQRAAAALRTVGLDPTMVASRLIDELSGGEQRRVALAGMLVREPSLIVLDEPYAGLDDQARAVLASVLSRLRSESGVATVVVSHDLDDVDLLGDRLLTLDEGRLVDGCDLGDGS
jgi:energy-coupling factor transport system ATP-binding protein